jgi:hypothetical protein
MRIGFGLIVAVIAFIGMATGPAVAATIYNLNIQSGGTSATGSITTDSTLGVLAEMNILDWNLRLETGGEFALVDGSNSGLLLFGTALTATESELFFDFSSVAGGLLVFQGPFLGSGRDALCLSDTTTQCYDDVSQVVVATAIQIDSFPMIGNVQIASVGTVSLPAALPLFASALGGLGLAAWRRRQGARAEA